MSTDSEQPAAAGPDMRGGGPRWLKRLLIGSGLLVLLLVVGAVLAVVNRTSLLAWAVETYLEDDTWKWSLKVRKEILPGFHIIGQASRDHQRWEGPPVKEALDFEEALVKKAHWSWLVKTIFIF